jgi:butyrate kinase
MIKILVINPGSTSTKIAYYEDEKCLNNITAEHPLSEINKFSSIMEQYEYRLASVEKFMQENSIDVNSLSAVVSRGGHTRPLEGGVYRINDEMLLQQESGLYGRHPSDIGSKIAYEICNNCNAVPLVVDPPVTDEFEAVARVSGHPLFVRRSSFHALNHKATAKRYAKETGVCYESLNLIVVHLGGGISVAPHKNGRMVDGDNALDGDGAFSTNRSGYLPVGELVKLCFSGKYTQKQIERMLNSEGGLAAYLGDTDVKSIIELAKADEKAALYLDAMIYQICKQIGAMSTVLEGKIDAIIITGGIAHSAYIIDKIKVKCGFIAKIIVYPGENEMSSLANGAYQALCGLESIRELEPSQ